MSSVLNLSGLNYQGANPLGNLVRRLETKVADLEKIGGEVASLRSVVSSSQSAAADVKRIEGEMAGFRMLQTQVNLLTNDIKRIESDLRSEISELKRVIKSLEEKLKSSGSE
jgi:hypothetical protein